MKIERMTQGDATVLKPVGCLDTAATEEFTRAIGAVADAAGPLVFDFSELEFIASSALRQLVALEKRRSAGGGEIAITGMNDVVRDVFEVTGLDEIFTIR